MDIVLAFSALCTLNTSFVERLNLTIRQGPAYLRRRSPCHARCEDQLRAHVELLRCHYNSSCPKTQTNSRLVRRAVSIVIDPWRAPDLGRVGGDVGDSGSPYAQGKTPSSNGMPRSWAETWIQARAAPGPERASRLRRGSPGLDSGLLGRPLFRRCTALSATRSPPLGANVALENRD